MGADYTAYAIIGVELPPLSSLPKMMKRVRKRAFKHTWQDDGETEFDPKTGKPLWLKDYEDVETDDPVVVYDTDDDGNPELGEGQKVLKAPKGMSFHYGTDSSPIFFGVVVRTGSSNGGDETSFVSVPDVVEVKRQLKDCLEPLGLWVEKDFGLYVNLYCSY